MAPGGGFTGTGQLFRLALRRDRVVGTAWVLGLFLFAYSQAASIVSLYPTQADLDRLARTAGGIGANPALVALQGPAFDASTYGGATAWQVVTPGVLLIGLMSILLVTRHTRQEEENRPGRAGQLRCGRQVRLAGGRPAVRDGGQRRAGRDHRPRVHLPGAPRGRIDHPGRRLRAQRHGLRRRGRHLRQLTAYARPANGMALAVLGAAFLLRAIGDTATGLSFGVIAQDMVQFARDDPETAKMLTTLGGSGSITDIYLAAVLSRIGMLAAGYAVQATLRLRAEEAEQRAEPVLATTASRTGWAASHLLVAAGGAAVVLTTGGVLAGLAHGLRSGDVGGQLVRVVAGALVQVPAVWVMAAVGAALFGLAPRLVVGATWAILAVVLSITLFGQPLRLGRWVQDLSPFAHLPRLPAAAFTATPLAWLLVVAALLAAAGLAAFRRRDLASGA